MRKKLGQYFLKDKSVLRKIAWLLDAKPNDVIVEIGPGHGELTKYLLEAKPEKVIAIEKDKRLVGKLRKNIQFPISNFQTNPKSQNPKLEIVEDDILRALPTLFNQLKTDNYKLIGNIPYYITGYLLRILGELEHKPELIVLTVQKEVAERICAIPPKMNLLAASVQFWATPTIAGVVNRKAFNPPPEVDSAIIKLVPKSYILNSKSYYQFIKILFKQPRKTVLNNLSAGLEIPKEEAVKRLTKQGIKPGMRPQNLSIEDLLNLSVDNVFRAKK